MSKDIERKLLIERQKLSALLEITNAVNRNYKIDELMSQFQDVMRDYIGVNKLAFINNVNQWQCILHYGVNDACEDFDYSSLTQFKTPTFTNDTAFDKLDEFELILPVFHKEKPLSYLLIGGIGEGEMINFIQNHVGFVQTLANVVSVAIETKTLAKEVLKKKLEEKDMEFAAEMQKLLLPDDLPSNQHLNISATYIAKNMVTKWGLSDELGPLTYSEDEGEVFLGRQVTQHKSMSDTTADKIDKAVRDLIDRNYKRAEEILHDNIEKLHLMAKALIKYETIDSKQIAQIMEGHDPTPPAGWEASDDDDDSGNKPPKKATDPKQTGFGDAAEQT